MICELFINSKFNEMQVERIAQQPMIKVVVRKRPLSKKQISRSEHDVVQVPNGQQVIVKEQKLKVDLTRYVDEHQFRFDQAMDQTASNREVYNECVRPLVQCAFKGAKVTCFAYGQTGSGKTYTMNGDHDNGVLGMYYLGAEDIFAFRDEYYPNLEVHLSFYEIYCSKLFDLFNGRQQLQAREDAKQNVNIVGLTVKRIANASDFMAAVAYGSSIRITSQNSTNADSSRSHAILQVQLRSGKRSHGKMTFIDLAGCERGADTLEQNKQTKIDGAQINKSLLALKECIRALDQGKNHTPFRGSKLTMVLKDSFTGFCRTVMIANIAPGSSSCQNTLNTLRYADRVKTLKKATEPSKDRQIVLPRNYRSRHGTNSECSEEDKTPSCLEPLMKMINASNLNQKGKKNRYIMKDENQKASIETPMRKAILVSQNPHGQPLKSVNHLPKKRDVSRNKSLVIKEKIIRPIIQEKQRMQRNASMLLPKREPILTRPVVQESEWDRAVRYFHQWTPSPGTFAEMSQLFQKMVHMMMKEEVDLTESHRSFMMQEEQAQRQLASLYLQAQTDGKNNSQMLDWAGRLSHMLQSKTEGLIKLKERSQIYQQHLRDHEFCEERLVMAGELFTEGQMRQ